MSVDAFVAKSGLKMVSTLHSSTQLKGQVSLKDGQIFNAEWEPSDKTEILSVKLVQLLCVNFLYYFDGLDNVSNLIFKQLLLYRKYLIILDHHFLLFIAMKRENRR